MLELLIPNPPSPTRTNLENTQDAQPRLRREHAQRLYPEDRQVEHPPYHQYYLASALAAHSWALDAEEVWSCWIASFGPRLGYVIGDAKDEPEGKEIRVGYTVKVRWINLYLAIEIEFEFESK